MLGLSRFLLASATCLLCVVLLYAVPSLAGGARGNLRVCRLKRNCDWPQLTPTYVVDEKRMRTFDVLPETTIRPGLYINSTCGIEMDSDAAECADDYWIHRRWTRWRRSQVAKHKYDDDDDDDDDDDVHQDEGGEDCNSRDEKKKCDKLALCRCVGKHCKRYNYHALYPRAFLRRLLRCKDDEVAGLGELGCDCEPVDAPSPQPIPEPEPPVACVPDAQVPVYCRDFRQSHPNMQRAIDGHVTGAVLPFLDPTSRLPVFAGPPAPGTSFTNAGDFDEWFRDTPNVNVGVDPLFVDPRDAEWRYPLDGKGFGNQGDAHNYLFTCQMHTEFVYTGGADYALEVGSDDDSWAFVDGQLVLDNGGVHSYRVEATNVVPPNMTIGETYTLDVFFAERHRTRSRFTMQSALCIKCAAGYYDACGVCGGDNSTCAPQPVCQSDGDNPHCASNGGVCQAKFEACHGSKQDDWCQGPGCTCCVPSPPTCNPHPFCAAEGGECIPLANADTECDGHVIDRLCAGATCTCCITPPPPPPPPPTCHPDATVPVYCRDFKASHPDMQRGVDGLVTGAVKMALNVPERKPIFNNPGTASFSTAANFDQWFRSVPAVNVAVAPFDVPAQNPFWTFPLDGKGYGNMGDAHNYFFTCEIHTEFVYTGSADFALSIKSDDDSWAFINGTLVLDNGGVHAANTEVATEPPGLVVGERYRLDVFTTERHRTRSVIDIQTDLCISCEAGFYDHCGICGGDGSTCAPTPSPEPSPSPTPSPEPSPSPTPSPEPSPSPTPSPEPSPSPTPSPEASPSPTPSPEPSPSPTPSPEPSPSPTPSPEPSPSPTPSPQPSPSPTPTPSAEPSPSPTPSPEPSPSPTPSPEPSPTPSPEPSPSPTPSPEPSPSPTPSPEPSPSPTPSPEPSPSPAPSPEPSPSPTPSPEPSPSPTPSPEPSPSPMPSPEPSPSPTPSPEPSPIPSPSPEPSPSPSPTPSPSPEPSPSPSPSPSPEPSPSPTPSPSPEPSPRPTPSPQPSPTPTPSPSSEPSPIPSPSPFPEPSPSPTPSPEPSPSPTPSPEPSPSPSPTPPPEPSPSPSPTPMPEPSPSPSPEPSPSPSPTPSPEPSPGPSPDPCPPTPEPPCPISPGCEAAGGTCLPVTGQCNGTWNGTLPCGFCFNLEYICCVPTSTNVAPPPPQDDIEDEPPLPCAPGTICGGICAWPLANQIGWAIALAALALLLAIVIVWRRDSRRRRRARAQL